MNFRIVSIRPVNILAVISALFWLLGTALGASDFFSLFKRLQPAFAPVVVRIDKGIHELSFFPPDGDTASLKAGEDGFDEILKIIYQNDQFAL